MIRKILRTRAAGFACCALLVATAAGGSDAVAPAAGASEPPETIRWPSAVGEVVFPHRAHAEDFGAECSACHHDIVAAALEVPHPSYFDDFWVDCATCHTDGAGATEAAAPLHRCASCHPPRALGPNAEMPSVKVAVHRSCWSCHDTGRGAAASAQCATCHRRPQPSSAAAQPAASAEARTP